MRGQITRWIRRTGTECELRLTKGEFRRAAGRGGQQALMCSYRDSLPPLYLHLWALLDVPSCLKSFLHFLQGLCHAPWITLSRPMYRPRFSFLRHHPPIPLSTWGFSKTKALKSPLRTIPSNTLTSKELPVTPDRVLHLPQLRDCVDLGRSSENRKPGAAWIGKHVRRLAAV